MTDIASVYPVDDSNHLETLCVYVVWACHELLGRPEGSIIGTKGIIHALRSTFGESAPLHKALSMCFLMSKADRV